MISLKTFATDLLIFFVGQLRILARVRNLGRCAPADQNVQNLYYHIIDPSFQSKAVLTFEFITTRRVLSNRQIPFQAL